MSDSSQTRQQKKLRLCQLYPSQLNMYGDWGNTLVLKRRAEALGFAVEVINHELDQPADLAAADVLIGGGGQDSGQIAIHQDLLSHRAALADFSAAARPILAICGMYQLLGESFEASNGQVLEGLGIFAAHTTAGRSRIIGNIAVKSPTFGMLYGYENHQGRTHLAPGQLPLGTTAKGCGNNDADATEGALTECTIGSYLHGSLLPKNPRLADALLHQAIQHRYPGFEPVHTEDAALTELTEQARKVAASRPR